MSIKNFLASRAWILIPILAAGIFFGLGLARLPLEDADEATYAMVVREMIAGGNYATLTLFGEPWFEKPPLLFWLMAASSKIFGLNEFALRLPIALSGVFAVAFTSGIIWELARKKEPALIGGLLLVFMPLFLATARNVRMDMPVIAAILGALYFFMKGRDRPVFFLGFGALIGAGILFKSVVALLAVPVILIYAASYRDWSWSRNKYFWLGGGLGLLIVLPWHLYEIFAFGSEFISQYLGLHVIGRAAENIIDSRITNSYVLRIFWTYGRPASLLFLPAAVIYFLLPRNAGEAAASNAAARGTFDVRTFDGAAARNLTRFGAFSLSSFAFIFGLFMLPATKLIPYFTPAYPFLAMFLAAVYERISVGIKPIHQNVLRIFLIIVLAVGFEFSFKEAFSESHLYVTDTSYDSREIGTAISRADETAGVPVYIYEFQSDQTIQYYSARRVEHVGSDAELAPPFFLVIPTELIGQKRRLDGFTELYGGRYLSLFDVRGFR